MAGSGPRVTDSTIAVLDIDGTLIDSNYQHALAWYRALRSVGETCPVWRLHRLIGMGGDQVPAAVGGEDLERRVGDRARERQGKEVDALLEEMAPLPGARAGLPWQRPQPCRRDPRPSAFRPDVSPVSRGTRERSALLPVADASRWPPL